jgi:hypothetical protein
MPNRMRTEKVAEASYRCKECGKTIVREGWKPTLRSVCEKTGQIETLKLVKRQWSVREAPKARTKEEALGRLRRLIRQVQRAMPKGHDPLHDGSSKEEYFDCGWDQGQRCAFSLILSEMRNL